MRHFFHHYKELLLFTNHLLHGI